MSQPSPGDFRKEFTFGALRRKDLAPDPIEQFKKWLLEAEGKTPDPYAMTLATCDPSGAPSARMVLLKCVDARGLVFCTSYDSPKARELESNPKAALVFYWPETERQVRIAGLVERTPKEESERYFDARPEGARLAVLAGTQSSPIASRQALEERFAQASQERRGKSIARPEHWGGYLVRPTSFEFWQGGRHRLHDRFLYARAPGDSWTLSRLSP